MDAETRAAHMRMARQVKDEHTDGGQCDECPKIGRCPRLAAWSPWIFYVNEKAGRP